MTDIWQLMEKWLGPALAELRKQAGLTQEELGHLIGKTGSDISNYERGKTSPKAKIVGMILHACGFRLSDLEDAGEYKARLAGKRQGGHEPVTLGGAEATQQAAGTNPPKKTTTGGRKTGKTRLAAKPKSGTKPPKKTAKPG